MKNDSNNASFVYSVNLLRMLLGMELITEDEYNRIVAISEEHYGAKIYCVCSQKSSDFRWMFPNSCGICLCCRKANQREAPQKGVKLNERY